MKSYAYCDIHILLKKWKNEVKTYLEVFVLIVPGPVIGVPLLEGVPVHRVGRDVPKEHTSRILFNVLEGSDVRLSNGWAGTYLPKEHTSGILFNILEGSDVRLSTGGHGCT